MAVRSPVWAVLAAHGQSTLNALLRQVSRRGVIWMVLVSVVMVGTAVLPMILGLSALAFWLADLAFTPGSPRELLPLLGLALSLFPIFGGMIGGAAGGTKQLAWERYRGFPLRSLTLFRAELLAQLGDFVTLILVLAIVCISGAIAVAAPATAPWMPGLALELVLLLLGLQLLVSSLAQRLVKRLWFAISVTLMLAWASSVIFAPRIEAVKATDVDGLKAAGRTALEAFAWLPPTQLFLGARDEAWGVAAFGLLGGAAVVLLVLASSYSLLLRERDETTIASSAPARPLWSFRRAWVGIAQLQLRTLLGSHFGKYGFAVPLISVVMIKGPFSQLNGRGWWLVPGAFAYASLAGGNIAFNQFGLDGHGVKSLFLLPITEEEILDGKQAAFALWQLMQATLLAVLLWVLQAPPLDELGAGMLLYAGQSLVQATVGQRMSAWVPRRVGRMKNPTMPLPAVLVALGSTIGCSLTFGGAFGLLKRWERPLLLPGMLALALVAFGVSRALNGWNARYLRKHRERIIDAVG